MFDFGWSELLVIAVVAIVVVGPRELPGMLRTFGKYAGQLRSMAGDFQRQFNDALKDAELDDVRKSIESVRSVNPLNQMKDSLNPLKAAGEGVRKAMEDPGAPKPETAAKSEAKPKSAASKTGTSKTAASKKAAPAKSTAAPKKTAAKKPAARKPAAAKAADTAKAAASAKKTAAAKGPAAAKPVKAPPASSSPPKTGTTGSGATKSSTTA